MDKTVFYLVTRNLYPKVIPSLKSLLKNGNVDEVIIMAEDRDIGIDFPTRAKVSIYNIQPLRDKLLNPEGPNYNSRWTYMVMMKTALCKMFLDVHRALTLDVDTIVRDDLSPMWEIDLEDYYFAGAREPFWSDRFHRDYVNAGVLMWNFDKMRDGTADRLIRAMNTRKFTFVEQDCINELCWDRIKVISSIWNAGDWTEKVTSGIKIRHYLASHGTWVTEPEVIKYGEMPWREVIK